MPWETEELIPLDDFDGDVVSALWVTGKGGYPQLELTLHVNEVYAPADASGLSETKAWYSTGQKGGWEIIDGGLRVVPEKPGQKFHGSSKYGKLLNRVAKELQLSQVINKGEPEEALIWVGERFRMVRVAESYKGLADAEGGEARDVETSILLPTEYRTGGVAATVPASVASPTAVAAPASGSVYSLEELVILQGLAKGKSSAQEVKLAVARSADLNTNTALMHALIEGNLVAELEAEGKLTVKDGVYQ